jgi:phosphoglycerate dehydrogenase-like enzyme
MKNILIDIQPFPPLLQKLQEMPDVNIYFKNSPVEIPKDIHFFFGDAIPEEVLENQKLELIQIGSVGFNQLYGLNLPQRGVRVCNARGVFDSAIAEWTIAMMIILLRDLPEMLRNQQQGIWDRDARFQRELHGSTIGVWGYGGIGRATARLAKSFGLKVNVLVRNEIKPRHDIYQVPETGDPQGTLPDHVFTSGEEKEFLSQLDFLIIAVPQTPQTVGMIGEEQLRALPKTAFVLNPARGPIIQEEALLRALRENWIAGAALDTHYQYPMPANHPLWHFPNVIMTPHISGSNAGAHYPERIWDIFVQNVSRFLQEKPLLNELSAEQLNVSIVA